MFPYPSGDGLHIGHAYNYAIMDSWCKWKRFQGYEVFQPFGYDAFGLPAENYAKKCGRNPKDITYENIYKFRQQMLRLNTDYEELLITSDESYYKWTQWLFLKLYKAGLAYKKFAQVNYCPNCDTVLANEQVNENICKLCDNTIQTKNLNQWFLRITDYKQRLIDNLTWIDYPEKTKKQQKEWLTHLRDWCISRQRKWGCPIPIEGEQDTLDTFLDSSFYWLRYLDPHNKNYLFNLSKYHQPDIYVGGNEHACMHLIYARFINMFLYDEGIVPKEEPFKKLIHQGIITHHGARMSKSRNNCISMDIYDPDELRLYLMFLGPYTEGGDWDDSSIKGITRFLCRLKKWLRNIGTTYVNLTPLINKIDNSISRFKFNLVVSELMKFYNHHKNFQLDYDTTQKLITIIRCFAPNFIVGT